MAKNISLMGADYPDVPAVQLPQTGGGTATFYDIEVIDSLDSDSSTDALSAKQGKVLSDKIGGMSMKTLASIANNGSKSYTIANASRVMLIIDGGTPKGIIIVNSSSTGGVTTESIGTLTGITVSKSNNTITISNTSGTNAAVAAIIMTGSIE